MIDHLQIPLAPLAGSMVDAQSAPPILYQYPTSVRQIATTLAIILV